MPTRTPPPPSLAPTVGDRYTKSYTQGMEAVDRMAKTADDQMLRYYELARQQQEQANAWSAEQAQRAMDYQTDMSNTAHQREVADLKAAGLNPVLSAGGAGATTGSGIAASAGTDHISGLVSLAGKAMQASMEQAKSMAETAKSLAKPVTAREIRQISGGSSGKESERRESSSGSGSGSRSRDVSTPSDSKSSSGDADLREYMDNYLDSGIVNAIEDLAYRFVGVRQDDMDDALYEICTFLGSAAVKGEEWYKNAADWGDRTTYGLDKTIESLFRAIGGDSSAKRFLQMDDDHNGHISQLEHAKYEAEQKEKRQSSHEEKSGSKSQNTWKKLQPDYSKHRKVSF